MITVIGIGTKKGEITELGTEKIATVQCAYLRSAKTEAGGAVVKKYPHVLTLDECFESAQSFDDWSEKACETVLAAEREHGEAIYLTDGDGYGDIVAIKLSERTQVEFCGGVAPHASRAASLGTLHISASEAVQTLPELDTAVALHVTEIDDAYLAGDVKLWLMEYYGDETEITVAVGNKTQRIKLCELDRVGGYGYSCEAYIAPQETFRKQKYSFGDLQRIMRRLTAPDGCPWDKVQTHESVRINLIEEAYEAVDAIDSGDLDAQIEEMGDVLLQSVLHCDIARRHGEYTIADVLSALCSKLVSRHTHIFGQTQAHDADEALGNWEAAKAEDKSYVSTADKLNRLPECFPALLAAEKVYKKLIKAGVKADEKALAGAKACTADATEEQIARKIFWLVAATVERGVDAEAVLGSYISKLKRTFESAEKAGEISDFLIKS